MKKLTKLQNIIFQLGAFLILVGAATYITGWSFSFYIYTIGACMFSAMQMYAGYEGNNIIIKRLRSQQILGAVALLVAAGLMAMDTFRLGVAQRNEWMVALAIACVLELYTAFRIPSELERESKKRKQ